VVAFVISTHVTRGAAWCYAHVREAVSLSSVGFCKFSAFVMTTQQACERPQPAACAPRGAPPPEKRDGGNGARHRKAQRKRRATRRSLCGFRSNTPQGHAGGVVIYFMFMNTGVGRVEDPEYHKTRFF
jgi:hypothetical protein